MDIKRKYQKYSKNLLNSERISLAIDTGLHGNIPKAGGIYRITQKGKPKESLYIGKAKSLRQRVYTNLMHGQIRSHTLKGKLIRNKVCRTKNGSHKFLATKCFVQFIEEPDPRERIFIEHYLIAMERPIYND